MGVTHLLAEPEMHEIHESLRAEEISCNHYAVQLA